MGRTAYVLDLHAAGAIYHQQCSVNFRTGKGIPQGPSPSKHLKRGRRSDEVLDAFLKVAKVLEDNDDEQTSIGDLIDKMREYLPDSHKEKAYGFTYMKYKLEGHFGDRIIISEIAGKPSVVTFKTTAAAILHEFQEKNRKSEGTSHESIIVAA